MTPSRRVSRMMLSLATSSVALVFIGGCGQNSSTPARTAPLTLEQRVQAIQNDTSIPPEQKASRIQLEQAKAKTEAEMQARYGNKPK